MDYQNRAGNKGAGVAGASEANVDRRERLRKLALETIDVSKDPYILRNHLGSYECRLCLTLHVNEGSYLSHTQGKKHQANLGRRAARESRLQQGFADAQRLLTGPNAQEVAKKRFVKIGRPGYKITKIREPYLDAAGPAGPEQGGAEAGAAPNGPSKAQGGGDFGGRMGLLFQIHLPQIKDGVKPTHRFMSSFEQRVEMQNRAWQYLVVAAEPYETVAFKLQAREIDRTDGVLFSAMPGSKPKDEPGTWSHWDPDVKTCTIQVLFRG